MEMVKKESSLTEARIHVLTGQCAGQSIASEG